MTVGGENPKKRDTNTPLPTDRLLSWPIVHISDHANADLRAGLAGTLAGLQVHFPSSLAAPTPCAKGPVSQMEMGAEKRGQK